MRKTGCFFIPQGSKVFVSKVGDHGWENPRQFIGLGMSEEDLVRLLVERCKNSPQMRPQLRRYPRNMGDCVDLTTALILPWYDTSFNKLGINGGMVVSSIFGRVLERCWVPLDLGQSYHNGGGNALSSQTFYVELGEIITRKLRGNGPVTVQEIAARSLKRPVRWFADTCVGDC